MNYKKDPAELCYIIQARLSSQRAPRKMIRPFAGTTLVDIALQKVLESRFISRENFYFAVHDEELKQVARKHDVQIFHRSNKSAMAEDSLQDIYEWHDQLDYDYVIKINACAPFLRVRTIDAFIETFLKSESQGLFGVVRKKNYFWSASKQLITPWPEGPTIMNTKRVEPTFEAAHCLYASRMDGIRRNVFMGSFQKANDPALFEMDELEAFDIDFEWQFVMGEKFYQARTLIHT